MARSILIVDDNAFIRKALVGSGNSGTLIPEILARSPPVCKVSSRFR